MGCQVCHIEFVSLVSVEVEKMSLHPKNIYIIIQMTFFQSINPRVITKWTKKKKSHGDDDRFHIGDEYTCNTFLLKVPKKWIRQYNGKMNVMSEQSILCSIRYKKQTARTSSATMTSMWSRT